MRNKAEKMTKRRQAKRETLPFNPDDYVKVQDSNPNNKLGWKLVPKPAVEASEVLESEQLSTAPVTAPIERIVQPMPSQPEAVQPQSSEVQNIQDRTMNFGGIALLRFNPATGLFGVEKPQDEVTQAATDNQGADFKNFQGGI